ncbi:uncharacterized protein LOC123500167 isoform X2 [Portunus trituberculatus]|uniref:uncharacterized protein LOC123500167 isoform X2 n=1 Tax=Portunus trituberculatus TaxID=210409 RepID=UPI001E1CB420|nr:uncharacterized protein LOC123500167 isoform X2 [Portunus trituberculatus]
MLETVGQVVVYSIAGCPHCLAAKKTLRDSGVPFIDVPVDRFPSVQNWLQEKTGQTSVPQIFFNETFVGGNDSLQRAIKDEEEWNKLLSDIQTNEPKEGALNIPHPSEATDAAASEFVCENDPSAPIVEELQESGILHDHRTSLFSSTKNVFSGHHFIKWIMRAKEVDEKEAHSIGQDLLSKKYILPLQNDAETNLLNDPKVYYRLNDTSHSSALNAGPTQKCKLGDAGELSEALRKTMLKLTNDHISADGKVVNYLEMRNAEEFDNYVKMSKELQHVAVEKLSQDESKAFFINIYNALVIHATAVNGSPSNWFSRLRFFDKTSYVIGGHTYSLNDIENGVLRANKRGALQFFAPFGKSDPRLKTSQMQVDPRIHFALNCGAKSCPPIKTFSSSNVNEELRIATEAYLESDEALQVDEDQGIIRLSSLLKWYSSDFGETLDEVLQWVLQNVAYPKKKAALQSVVDVKKYKVRYITYDWGSNSLD